MATVKKTTSEPKMTPAQLRKKVIELEAKVDKKLALFKKGKFKEKDSEELEQIEKSIRERD